MVVSCGIGSCPCDRFARGRMLFFPQGKFVCWGRLGASVIQLVWVLVFPPDIFEGFGFSSSLSMWCFGHVMVSMLGGLI